MERKMKRQKGIALVQGIILAGLVAAASALVVNYSQKSHEDVKKAQRFLGASLIPGLVKKTFLNERICKSALSGKSFDKQGGSTPITLRDASGNTILGPGLNIRGVKIEDIAVSYPPDTSWGIYSAGEKIAQLSKMLIKFSYQVGTSTLEREITVEQKDLPFVVKSIAGGFIKCDYTNLSEFNELAKTTCEILAGEGAYNVNGEINARCDLSLAKYKLEGINPDAMAGGIPYSELGVGRKRVWDYFDSRFLKLSTGGDFEPRRGLRFIAPLRIQSGTGPYHLINIKQTREAIQGICQGQGLGIFTPVGIVCLNNTQCGLGESLTGFNANGEKVCRPVFFAGGGTSGCPKHYDFILEPNAKQEISIRCREVGEWRPSCTDSSCGRVPKEGMTCGGQSACAPRDMPCDYNCWGLATGKKFSASEASEHCHEKKPAPYRTNCPGTVLGLSCREKTAAVQPHCKGSYTVTSSNTTTTYSCSGFSQTKCKAQTGCSWDTGKKAVHTCQGGSPTPPQPKTYNQYTCHDGTWLPSGTCSALSGCHSSTESGGSACCQSLPSGKCGKFSFTPPSTVCSGIDSMNCPAGQTACCDPKTGLKSCYSYAPSNLLCVAMDQEPPERGCDHGNTPNCGRGSRPCCDGTSWHCIPHSGPGAGSPGICEF